MSFPYKFGWKKDHPDFRDFKFGVQPEPTALVDIPMVVDIREEYPQIPDRIKDQGNANSCVGNGLGLAFETCQIELLSKLKSNPFYFGTSIEDIARLFIYYNGRLIDGDTDQDEGTFIRSGILGLRKYGVCRETVWPYDVAKVLEKPSDQAYAEGKSHLTPTGYRVNHTKIEEIQKSLALGYPVVFGATLYESFQDIGANGRVVMPQKTENVLGGHCMTILGYNTDLELLIVGNSWGKKWGDKGFCYFPFAYLTDTEFASDFWSLQLKM